MNLTQGNFGYMRENSQGLIYQRPYLLPAPAYPELLRLLPRSLNAKALECQGTQITARGGILGPHPLGLSRPSYSYESRSSGVRAGGERGRKNNPTKAALNSFNKIPDVINAKTAATAGDFGSAKDSCKMCSEFDMDTILKMLRSIECKCCQQHFGYQLRANKDVFFCSTKCIKSHEEQEGLPQIARAEAAPKLEVPTLTATRFRGVGDLHAKSPPVPTRMQKTEVLENVQHIPKLLNIKVDMVDSALTNVSKMPPSEAGSQGRGSGNRSTIIASTVKENGGVDCSFNGAGIDETNDRGCLDEATAPSKLKMKPGVGLPLRPPIDEPKFTKMVESSKPVPAAPPAPQPTKPDMVARNFTTQPQLELDLKREEVKTKTEGLQRQGFPDFPVIILRQNPRMALLSKTLEWPELPLGIPLLVSRSHHNSPTDIYVQTTQMRNDAQLFTAELYEMRQARKLRALKIFDIGTPCVAPFDGDFYRGEIIGHNSVEQVELFFTDYGNISFVTRYDLFEMPDEMLKIPRRIVQCQWDLGATDEMIEKDKAEIYMKDELNILPKTQIAEGQYVIGIGSYQPKSTIKIEAITTRSSKTSSVASTTTTAPKAQARQVPALPTPPPVPMIHKTVPCSKNINSNMKVGICFTYNLTRHLIGSYEDDNTREEMQAKFAEMKFEPYSGIPVLGEVVMGKYQGDVYRGVVTGVNGDKITLEFMDYGDTEVNDLKDLKKPNEFALSHPFYGMCVNLDIDPKLAKTSPEIERLAAQEMTVEFCGPNKTRPQEQNVILWIDGISLNDAILGKTPK